MNIVQKDRPLEAAGARGEETILLADDEDLIRTFGERLLTRLGYSVLLARDGAELLEVYRNSKTRVNAVILDMAMPNLAGPEALRLLLELDPGARVIATSGAADADSLASVGAGGARVFLHKPFTIRELATALRRCLDE
jgi:two-component system, cell cycle sensor histidine kinase and response regulator CckA